jgi:hypothetical protein
VWTTEDNEKLQAVVEDIGTGNWDEVAARVVTRTARQCRERWQNYLCASVPREPWTNDEDRLLLEKVGMWGRKWRRIAQFLQGRTDLDVKKRFFTLNTPQPGHAAAFNVVNPQLGTAADALRGSVQVPLELAAPEGTTGIGAPGGVAPDGVGAQ